MEILAIVVTLVCTIAILGSHIFFIYEHKAMDEKLVEILRKLNK